MKKDGKRVIKSTLWILLGILILIAAGYLISSYLRLNTKNIPQEEFAGKTFTALDGITKLTFGAEATGATITTESGAVEFTVEYCDDIFTLSSEESNYEFIVITHMTLYGGDASAVTGQYFYNLE